MTEQTRAALPAWVREAADRANKATKGPWAVKRSLAADAAAWDAADAAWDAADAEQNAELERALGELAPKGN